MAPMTRNLKPPSMITGDPKKIMETRCTFDLSKLCSVNVFHRIYKILHIYFKHKCALVVVYAPITCRYNLRSAETTAARLVRVTFMFCVCSSASSSSGWVGSGICSLTRCIHKMHSQDIKVPSVSQKSQAYQHARLNDESNCRNKQYSPH